MTQIWKDGKWTPSKGMDTDAVSPPELTEENIVETIIQSEFQDEAANEILKRHREIVAALQQQLTELKIKNASLMTGLNVTLLELQKQLADSVPKAKVQEIINDKHKAPNGYICIADLKELLSSE